MKKKLPSTPSASQAAQRANASGILSQLVTKIRQLYAHCNISANLPEMSVNMLRMSGIMFVGIIFSCGYMRVWTASSCCFCFSLRATNLSTLREIKGEQQPMQKRGMRIQAANDHETWWEFKIPFRISMVYTSGEMERAPYFYTSMSIGKVKYMLLHSYWN